MTSKTMTQQDWNWTAQRLLPALLPSDENERLLRIIAKTIPATIQMWNRGKCHWQMCEDITMASIIKFSVAAAKRPGVRTGPYLKTVVHNQFLDVIAKETRRGRHLVFDHQLASSSDSLNAVDAERHLEAYFDPHARFDETAFHMGRLKIIDVVRRTANAFEGADDDVLLVHNLYIEEIWLDARRTDMQLRAAVRHQLLDQGMPYHQIRAVIPRWARRARPFLAELAVVLARQ